MSSLLEYECRVPVNGYEVVTRSAVAATLKTKYPSNHKIIDQWLLAGSRSRSRILRPRSKQTRRFNLFEFNPSAFLEFAQTPVTEDGLKNFVDRYGPLTTVQDFDSEDDPKYRLM